MDQGPVGRSKFLFKDACKRDMIAIGLDLENWETLPTERGRWRISSSASLDGGEPKDKKRVTLK